MAKRLHVAKAGPETDPDLGPENAGQKMQDPSPMRGAVLSGLIPFDTHSASVSAPSAEALEPPVKRLRAPKAGPETGPHFGPENPGQKVQDQKFPDDFSKMALCLYLHAPPT